MDDLKTRIFRDFSTLPSPGNNITVPFHGDLERAAIDAFFHGKRWQDIGLDDLRNGYKGDESACLTFMTPQAFRYYLSAYLLFCLEDFREARMSNLLPGTIWWLELDENNRENAALFFDRFDGYNEAQKRDIALFLKQMSEHHGEDFAEDYADLALKRYWSRYLPPYDQKIKP